MVATTTTIIMTLNTAGCVLVSLLLFRGSVSGSKTLDFDCGIDLSSCGIALWMLRGIPRRASRLEYAIRVCCVTYRDSYKAY